MGRFKVNRKGFRELRNSPEVQKALLEQADTIRQRANGLSGEHAGFAADVQPGKNRAHAVVKPITDRAAALCADRNVLLKAVGK